MYKTKGGGVGGKRGSDTRLAYPEVKVQVRDLVRVVGIVAPFDQVGIAPPGKNSFYRVPRGKWAQESVSPAAVCHGRARESSGMGPCGDCRRILWLPNPQGQYSVKIRFIEKPGYETMGVVMWLNVVLTPA